MTKPTYPKRPQFYALKFGRVVTKACVANELGAHVFALSVVVAMTEDAAKYQRGVTFYDSQLMPLIGAKSQDTLARVRAKAVAAGWLHYEPGRKGVPGTYWTLTPTTAGAFTDAPVDETPEELTAVSSAPVRTQAGQKSGECADEGDSLRTGADTSRENVRTEAGRKPGACADLPTDPFTSSFYCPEPTESASVPAAAESNHNAGTSGVVLTFPVRQGKRGTGPIEWQLTAAKIGEWNPTFPGVDVTAECRKALAWVQAKPERRKTSKGMEGFLVGWLTRESKGGERRSGAAAERPHPGYDVPRGGIPAPTLSPPMTLAAKASANGRHHAGAAA
ncbi:hypothetical protein [Limnoglobus roseus]|uniref:Helix-turn-helix domain-containing protein n=1 Tax=Limnoglobus roseus TaxID=2598579 RepID=A0A5C1AA62_9BACT|nr:hypothetical protein [Limnoglobus roseus]QEL15620.1 hypothetical protein PX52LOC_02553 [Limnoglobus roseus]